MRLTLGVSVLVVLGAGLLFAALNGGRVAIDFFFTRVELPLGAALLSALAAGWLIGGLVVWLSGAQARRDAARLRRRLADDRGASERTSA